MSKIVIDEISFVNYRQYGTGCIKFPGTEYYNLSILIAQNGTGKTTLLNSITWCLYGKEPQLIDKDKALPVLNTKVLKEAKEDDRQEVKVTLNVLDGDKIIEFTRQQYFIPKTGYDGVKKAIDGPEMFSVSTTVRGDFSNTKIACGIDADFLRKQYFHDDIFDFYFFDGENLKVFFTPGRAQDIKRSIYNISQVSLLENVNDHVQKLISRYIHELGKSSPDIEQIQNDIENQEKARTRAEETKSDANAEILRLTIERNNIDDILTRYKPISDLQVERKRLEKKAAEINAEKATLRVERSAFIRKYTVLIKLYPRIKSILKYISEKEANGELPPAIDIDQVKQLLDMLNGNLDRPCSCPMCNHEIGRTGRAHLEKLLAKASVSSKTSNFLKEIKGTLQAAIDEVHEYRPKRESFIKREANVEEDERRIATRLSEINKILINYVNDGDEKINISELEARRKAITNQIRTYDQSIGAATSNIKLCNDEIVQLKTKLDEAKKKLEQSGKTQQQLRVVSMMQRYYSIILSNITGGMRDEIKGTTQNIFGEMNWKTQTFGRMEIDDDYTVAVYDTNGLIMTASLSATEQMALAYSFILAIHKTSGRNCPLVIDSPIGRSSDKNRESIAEALLKISEDKQIIMLFTPDDFTVPVQELYASKAYIKKLSLAPNEKYIEGMDN